jgi:hypothetical protein
MATVSVTLNLTVDQLAGLDHEVARHNAEGEAAATDENPWDTVDRVGYVQFVMGYATQSYFNNMPSS